MNTVILNPLPAPLALTYYIPELSSDPVTPVAGDSWVLVTQTGHGGSGGGKLKMFMGLGFPYVSAGSGSTITYTYQFSYRTAEATTKRVTLT